MKKILLITIIALISPLISMANSNHLFKVASQSSSMKIVLNYPGETSSVCGYKFVAIQGYSRQVALFLQNNLIIKDGFQIQDRVNLPIKLEQMDHGSLKFELKNKDNYVTTIIIETTSDKSLTQIIGMTGKDIYLTALPCSK